MANLAIVLDERNVLTSLRMVFETERLTVETYELLWCGMFSGPPSNKELCRDPRNNRRRLKLQPLQPQRICDHAH